MERCPTCRARIKGATTCYRCGCDLTLALQAEVESQHWMRRAIQLVREGTLDEAEAALHRALTLHQTPLALALQRFFDARKITHSTVAAKPGFIAAERLAEEQPGFDSVQSEPSATRVWRCFRRFLGQPRRGNDRFRQPRLPNEPDGLIRGFDDIRFHRDSTGGSRFRLWRRIDDLCDSARERLSGLTSRHTAAPPKEPLHPLVMGIRAAAADVYQTLGPGLPALLYETCLCRELLGQGLVVRRNVPIAVNYKGTYLDSGFKMNLFVAEKMMVLIQGADRTPKDENYSLLNWLRAHGRPAGLWVDFNAAGTAPSRSRDG